MVVRLPSHKKRFALLSGRAQSRELLQAKHDTDSRNQFKQIRISKQHDGFTVY